MQPYQKASEELIRQGAAPLKAATTVSSAGISLGTFLPKAGLLAKRVLPFFSKYIPQDLAIKGISKINPRLGNFVKGAIESGNSFDDVKEFVQEKISTEKLPEPEQKKNIIEMFSPELHQFISAHIQQGRSPLEAGALASLETKGKNFKSIIQKLEKEHKSPWSAILETVYGPSQQQSKAALQQQEMNPGQQNESGIDPDLAQIMQQGMAIMQRRRGMNG